VKTDFKRFRLFGRLATVFAVLAIAAFAGCVICFDETVGWAIGIALLIVTSAGSVVFEWLAYDNLICPKCGHRIAVPKRDAYFDKANNERYRAIWKRQPVACVHCGATVETA